MKINNENTPTMIIGRSEKTHKIRINKEIVEQVRQFKYFGVVKSNEGNVKDKINKRLRKTERLYNVIKTNCLGKKEIPKEVKAGVVSRVVKPTLTFGSESWTLDS